MAVERGQAQQGQTVTLRMRFELGGTLFDPVEISQVQILDPSDAVLETITGAAIIKDAVGLYHVDWAIPAAAETETHHDRWFARATAGADMKQFTLNFFVLPFSASTGDSPYLTLEEATSYLPLDTALTSSEISALVLLSQEIVEAVAGQTFLPVDMARVFDGTGRRVLPLDAPLQNWSVLEYLYDSATGWTDVTPTSVHDLRIMRSKRMLALGNARSYAQGGRNLHRDYGCSAILTSALACSYFPAGTQNVRVTGSWGDWATVPRQVKAAVGALVRYAGSCDDPQALPGAAYSVEAVPGGRAYTLRQILFNAMRDRLTGFPDVDSILTRFPTFTPAVTVL